VIVAVHPASRISAAASAVTVAAGADAGARRQESVPRLT
jgi:hypothetical protein